jgi:2-dehydro-3-deoxy-phosphogluconate aldolase
MLAIMNRALGGRIAFNFLADSLENAREIWQASEGAVIFGVRVKDYPTSKLINMVSELKEEFGVVSLVLGDGDPNQWKKTTELALKINPGHINQVFPALGYTVGALTARGIQDENIVNALVAFSGIPGKVTISTGVLSRSSKTPAIVSVEAAMRMIKDVGGNSLKVLPFDSELRMAELEAIVAEMVKQKMDIIEPTGRINEHNIQSILRICLIDKRSLIIPHIHNAVLDPNKRTAPQRVEKIVSLAKSVMGL